MRAEYQLGNYTAKGWILKCAKDAYDDVLRKNSSKDLSMAYNLPADAFEAAIYAALDAAKETGEFIVMVEEE